MGFDTCTGSPKFIFFRYVNIPYHLVNHERHESDSFLDCGISGEVLALFLAELRLEPTKHDLVLVKQNECLVRLDSFAKLSGKRTSYLNRWYFLTPLNSRKPGLLQEHV
uniref:Uncharacterized protein n=1 Tax=Candidatus Kentrum sp. LFY TaxID=2126342 RepID=A0A450UJI4_9GAMM|nr:MAG: hypothetical protein BECKLFY1418B_GA0070995_103815 [Candidatus Kentron sp. LFY]